jgi:hypothetical protein
MLLRAVFRAVCGVVLLISAATAAAQTTAKTDCLFRNPLCFYDMDVLGYVQTLHRYQRYNEAAAFFYGPEVDRLGRAGVRVIEEGTKWSLTYDRTLVGTTRPLGLTSSRQIPASGQFTRMGVWPAVSSA